MIGASLVAHRKPAPDVFIYATGWTRLAVGDCIMIEDSMHGMRARPSF